MTAVYIIVGLVLAAAVVFFLMRKPGPAQLQGPEERKPLPPRPGDDRKKEEKRELPPPPPPKVTVRDTPLARQEVKPPSVGVGEEVELEPPSEHAPPKKRAPADVAGLRKGLTQTRTGFIARLAA